MCCMEFEDEADKYYDLIECIHNAGSVDTTIGELVAWLPDDKVSSLINSLEEFRCHMEFEDEGDEAARIETFLTESKVVTQVQSIRQHSLAPLKFLMMSQV